MSAWVKYLAGDRGLSLCSTTPGDAETPALPGGVNFPSDSTASFAFPRYFFVPVPEQVIEMQLHIPKEPKGMGVRSKMSKN